MAEYRLWFHYARPDSMVATIEIPDDLEEYSDEWYDYAYDHAPIPDTWVTDVDDA